MKWSIKLSLKKYSWDQNYENEPAPQIIVNPSKEKGITNAKTTRPEKKFGMFEEEKESPFS